MARSVGGCDFSVQRRRSAKIINSQRVKTHFSAGLGITRSLQPIGGVQNILWRDGYIGGSL